MKRLFGAFEESASRLIRNLYLLAGALGLAYAVSQGSGQTVAALCYVLVPLALVNALVGSGKRAAR
jgi:hypothetical protein